MKQTNNAIKFLLAQYRAIFKQAYLKGLVSAVVLTTGLAAGASVNAAAQDPLNKNTMFEALESADATLTVDGTDTSTGDTKYDAIQLDASTVTKPWNGTLSITGGNASSDGAADNFIKAGTAAGNLTGSGTLSISSGGGLTLLGGDAATKTLSVSIKTLTLGEGDLIVSGGSAAGVTAHFTEALIGGGDDSGTVTLTGTSAGTAVFSADTITFSDKGKIVLNGAAAEGDAVLEGKLSAESSAGTISVATGKFGTIKTWTDGEDVANITLDISGTGAIDLYDSNAQAARTLKLGSDATVEFGTKVTLKSGSTLDLTAVDKDNASAGNKNQFIIENGSNFVTTTAVMGDLLNAGGASQSGTWTLDGTIDLSKDAKADLGDLVSGSIANGSSNKGKIVAQDLAVSKDVGATLTDVNVETQNLSLTSGSLGGAKLSVSNGLKLLSDVTLASGKVTLSNEGTEAKQITGKDKTLTINADDLLDIQGAWTSNATIAVTSGSAGATLELNKGNSLSLIEGADLTVTGNDSKDASFEVNSGTLSLSKGSELVLTSGSFDVNSGSVTFESGSSLKLVSGTFTVANTKVDISEATVSGSTGATNTITATGAGGVVVFKGLAANVSYKAAQGGILQTETIESTDGDLAKLVTLEDDSSKLVLDNLNVTATENVTVTGADNGITQINKTLSGKDEITLAAGNIQFGDTTNPASGTINQNLTVKTNATVVGNWSISGGDKKLTAAEGGVLAIGDGTTAGAGSLTVDQIVNKQATAGSITVNSGSTLTVNGIKNALSDKKDEDGNYKPLSGGEAGYAGFDLEGTTVAVKGGTFAIGSAAAGQLLNDKAWEEYTNNQSEDKTKPNYVYDNFGKYTLTNNGTLKVDFSTDKKFSADQIKQMKDELITGSSGGLVTDGKFDIGAATITELDDALKPQEGNSGAYTMTWEDYQSVVQDGGLSSDLNDQLANTTVTDVNSPFYGNVGAVQSANTTLEVSDNASFAGAANNNNFFVSYDDEAANIDVTSGGTTVSLMGTGTVANVSLVAGNSEKDRTTLSLEQGRNAAEGDKFTITVGGVSAVDAGVILENTEIKVAQNVTGVFTGDVKVDVFTLDGDATFSDGKLGTNAEFNTLNTASGSTLAAENVTINQYATVLGDLKVNETLDITSTEKDKKDNPIYASVAGNVSAKTFNANTVDLLSGSTTTTETFNAKTVDILSGAVVNTNSATFAGNNEILGTVSAKASVDFAADSSTLVAGTLTTKNITFNKDGTTGANNNGALNILDGTVTADYIQGNTGAVIRVGQDSWGSQESKTGYLQVNDTLALNGATLYVDPDYEQNAALVAVKNLTDATKGKDVGTLDGNVYVGQNSAVGVGVSSLGELQSTLAQYMTNGKFSAPNDGAAYGSMLYFDRPVTIAYGYGIALTADSADPNADLTANTIYFGDSSALAVNTDNAKAGSAYITFAPQSAQPTADGGDEQPTVTGGKLIANGGDIVLFGDTYRKSYKLFDENITITDKFGNTDTEDAVIDVISANGFLTAELSNDNKGTISLNINKDQADVFLGSASSPVQTSLIAYINGYNGEKEIITDNGTESEEPAGETKAGDTTGSTTEKPIIPGVANENLLFTYNKDGSKNYDEYNNYFLSRVIFGGNAADAEKVARLGVYGGTAQAALTAGATTYEAVAGRMGVGTQNGNITFADNGQGAGLWVTPVYKNHDSDGFGAQGMTYGADLDLYGVALGADYTLENGLRVGAAFNVGSGDADGQGAGAGVSNDFDYYGFTVYGGFTMDQLSVVADVSYTAVDNDVEANTNVEKISASMDSSNLSFGVTAQYAFNMNGVSVTPHAGLRYTNIDMDDYTVRGSADIAKYSADSASIFSIPVGVTFAKEITSGAWTIKPALDLTLTANMGDDSVDGSVTWAGVENLKTNLESEVIDSFTYGAALGVSAKSGNMSFGFGVNYTGASSADEYGVSANARFVF